MADYLWTGGPAPIEYVTLHLCRDIYHCTHSELRKENLKDILTDLAVEGIESQVRGMEA